MSADLKTQIGSDADGYRVVVRDGCTLVHGPMPVIHFVALAGTDKGAVVSTELARLYGVTFAWGAPAAVKAMVAERKAALLATPAGQPEPTGLERWMLVGEHGASALAIVHHLCGHDVDDPTAHPHDPADLRRCLLLLGAAPELRDRLHMMGSVSPQWHALMRAWPELEASFEAEAAGCDWRNGEGHWEAPQTYDLMCDILAQADALAKQGNLFGADA